MTDRRAITLLDGGMGKALQEAGAPFRQPEWSALALIEAPEAVLQGHRDFIEAGAEVIITNNYAVVPFHIGERFAEMGQELIDLSGRLARAAADEADRPVLVAGSIPPLFGSYEPDRYRPDQAPAMLDMITTALAPYVDVFLAETQSRIDEALASLGAAQRIGKPVWVSASLDDGGGAEAAQANAIGAPLRSGEPVEDFCVAAAEAGADAVLFNCSQPEVMADAVRTARSVVPESVRVGAYANAFAARPQGYAANEALLGHRHDVEDGGFVPFVEEWLDAGADIVGGCCGIMPRHIADVRDALDR